MVAKNKLDSETTIAPDSVICILGMEYLLAFHMRVAQYSGDAADFSDLAKSFCVMLHVVPAAGGFGVVLKSRAFVLTTIRQGQAQQGEQAHSGETGFHRVQKFRDLQAIVKSDGLDVSKKIVGDALGDVAWSRKGGNWAGAKKYGTLNNVSECFTAVPDLEAEFEAVPLRHGWLFLTHSLYNMHATINDIPGRKLMIPVLRALFSMLQRGNLKCPTKFISTLLDGPAGAGSSGLTKCCYFKVKAVDWLVHNKFPQCRSELKQYTRDFVVFSNFWPNEYTVAGRKKRGFGCSCCWQGFCEVLVCGGQARVGALCSFFRMCSW